MDKASKAVRDSRIYKERAQPQERKRWGLLEKHKDYALRAASHRQKKTTLRHLRAKAADRNPDEFYFGMINKTGPSVIGKNRLGTVSGKKHGEGTIGLEAMRLFKTQDLGYVRMKRNLVGKAVEGLEKQLTGRKEGGRRIVFIEEEVGMVNGAEDEIVNEVKRKMVNGDEDEIVNDGKEEVLSEGEEEMVKEVNKEELGKERGREDIKTRNRRNMQAKQRGKLESRISSERQRLKALTEAEEALDLQRARMGKSPAVGGVNKHGTKFKVRKRTK